MPESGAPFDGGEDLVQRRGAPHLGVPLHCQHAAAGRAPDVVLGSRKQRQQHPFQRQLRHLRDVRQRVSGKSASGPAVNEEPRAVSQTPQPECFIG